MVAMMRTKLFYSQCSAQLVRIEEAAQTEGVLQMEEVVQIEKVAQTEGVLQIEEMVGGNAVRFDYRL